MSLTTLVSTGASSNRVDMIFMGDGYTAEETNTYLNHVNGFLGYMFSDNVKTDPFHRYENFFNVHYITTPSNESGVDDPSNGIYRDTALGGSYRYDGSTDRLLYINSGQAYITTLGLTAGTDISPEMRLVTTNSTKYGGGGGYYAVYAGGNGSAYEIALHEIGHSFAGLADEYAYGGPRTYKGTEPSAPNSTTDPTGAKWEHWLGYVDPVLGEVGVYEGSSYSRYGAYRPTENSKMRSLNKAYDPIAKEAIVLAIYEYVDPLDDWTGKDSLMSLLDPLGLFVDPIDTDVIDLQWSINGTAVAGDVVHFTLADYYLSAGTYTISAFAYDNTGLVRRDIEKTTQTIDWTVSISETPILEIAGAAADDVLIGAASRDNIVAGDGNDVIETRGGGDTVDGGNGVDTVIYTWLTAPLDANLGFQEVHFGWTTDQLINVENVVGSDHDDRIIGDVRSNLIEGGDGNDWLDGGDGHDWLDGGRGADHVLGGAGNDRLLLGEGDDTGEGGAGNDSIFGRGGDDVLIGGDGEDYLEGNQGADLVQGGEGHDVVRGRAGEDSLHGHAGNDSLFGGLDDDLVYGHDGEDLARGGDGADQIFGGAGDDRLFGGAGDDRLEGGSGADKLIGGDGSDVLHGGRGNDVLTGGIVDAGGDGNADVFVFGALTQGSNGRDTIADFEQGLDLVDLTGLGLTNFEDEVLPRTISFSTGIKIVFASDDWLLIDNMHLADFVSTDVIL